MKFTNIIYGKNFILLLSEKNASNTIKFKCLRVSIKFYKS